MVVPHTPASSKHTGWDCRQTTLGKVCVNVHNGLASHCCISITLNACIVYFELIQITWITCNTSQHSQRLWSRHRYSLHCTNLCYLVISLFNNPGHDSWCHFKLDVLLAKLCSSVCQDQVCNVAYAGAVQLAEDNHLVQPVQQLRPEVCLSHGPVHRLARCFSTGDDSPCESTKLYTMCYVPRASCQLQIRACMLLHWAMVVPCHRIGMACYTNKDTCKEH